MYTCLKYMTGHPCPRIDPGRPTTAHDERAHPRSPRANLLDRGAPSGARPRASSESADGVTVSIPGHEPHGGQRRRRQRLVTAPAHSAEPPPGHPVLAGLHDLLVGTADEVPPHHEGFLERLTAEQEDPSSARGVDRQLRATRCKVQQRSRCY